MAAEIPAPHEREGQRGQHQGHRQPAQLRDGQVFRQRGARGAALRRLAQALRAGGGAEQDQSLAPQYRPGVHHRHRADRHHHHGRQRGRRRQHDHRRLRAGEHLPAAALHPAQLPRLRLPRDQAVAHRHGGDVRHPLGQPRGRGRARRAAAERDGRRDRLRRRALPLRGAARHPRRHLVPCGAGHHDRHRGPERRRQVDHLAHPLPLLRHRVRLGQDRRPGRARGEPADPARGHRDRSAGHGALQRHDLLQHRLRPARREPGGGRGGGAARPHPRLHRRPAGRL